EVINNMTVLKLLPACKDYLWGGQRIKNEFNVNYDGDILAEAWELSCHPDGPSIIANGPYKGKTLRDYLESEGMDVLGTHCRRFREFPILTKFIDARDNLSIQVHPNNAYALQNEGQYGKTEMWYVLDAEPGAFLYYGFKQEISREEFEERIKSNTLLEVLNAVEVHKGDTLFIESGTLHAIGKGLLIAEIQQNSNVTYRVYDYGRVGKDGKLRDLHIEKALAVTNRVPIVQKGESYPHIADCDYFTVDKLDLDGRLLYRMQGNVGKESFLSILILDGSGTISNQGEKIAYQKGDSIFLPAGSGDFTIEGTCDALLTTIREKANPVRGGIIIGSAGIQIGLVDEANHIFAKKEFSTDTSKTPSEIIQETADAALKLLQENNVPLDQCIGIGVGVPGTVDRRSGTIIYSNNLRWENVKLRDELGKSIPCPVRISNDADCAAQGEAVAGAGKQYNDVVLLTLGNGVGGGIILNGEVFDGGIMGGSEVGHMVVRANGRACTCGRKGCLEAYSSVPALINAASLRKNKDMTLQEIFRERTDIDIEEVIEQYTEMLGTGIVNIVNLFRPQLVLLGGAMSEYADTLIPSLRKMMEEDSFGGRHGMIPEIGVAELGDEAGMIGAANL
ncbi:MAG: ROK family protein, partial [Solobacterium sp.]|nr:ROK family protein [Solobacterium sp.]